MVAGLFVVGVSPLASSPAKADTTAQLEAEKAALLAELPAGIDPCGERGEFHTFVFARPIFRSPIAIVTGEAVVREGFAFCDVCPV